MKRLINLSTLILLLLNITSCGLFQGETDKEGDKLVKYVIINNTDYDVKIEYFIYKQYRRTDFREDKGIVTMKEGNSYNLYTIGHFLDADTVSVVYNNNEKQQGNRAHFVLPNGRPNIMKESTYDLHMEGSRFVYTIILTNEDYENAKDI